MKRIGIALLFASAGIIIMAMSLPYERGDFTGLRVAFLMYILGIPLLLAGKILLYLSIRISNAPCLGKWEAIIVDAIVVVPAIIWLVARCATLCLKDTIIFNWTTWVIVLLFALDAVWLIRRWRSLC